MAEHLTGLEELVLLAVAALDGDAYGVSIQDRLTRAGMPTSLGVVYATLDRLEREGEVTSSLGKASAVRGGRRKRIFRATPAGLAAVAEANAIRARLRRLKPRPAP